MQTFRYRFLQWRARFLSIAGAPDHLAYSRGTMRDRGWTGGRIGAGPDPRGPLRWWGRS